nr:MAG TPA: hypothetical protein [Caudoviricetes sp.]DAT81998.1 MAG TPA: hypothetical protein [Caudoviricetes sp.]DAY55273.1 MAG TPA: hypothetical protein [Caudoviricetes sp.]
MSVCSKVKPINLGIFLYCKGFYQFLQGGIAKCRI